MALAERETGKSHQLCKVEPVPQGHVTLLENAPAEPAPQLAPSQVNATRNTGSAQIGGAGSRCGNSEQG